MRLSSFAAAAVIFSASLAAHADDMFTLTDGANTVTFTLPSSPTVASTFCGANPDYFCVDNVDVTTNGVTATANYIAFFDLVESGGLEIQEGLGFLVSQQGPALFTGDTSAPTFLLGTVSLQNIASDPPADIQTDLTVTIAPTPEPSSIALLGTGLLGFAGAMKRRFV